MMGCEGCFISAKGQARERAAITEQAKEYAKLNNVTMAIYKEADEYKFTTAELAISSGLPVLDIVSQYNRATT